LDNCKTYPCTLKIFGTVKTLKNAEHLVMVLHFKADAIVPNIVYILCIFSIATHSDKRHFPSSCEFDKREKILTNWEASLHNNYLIFIGRVFFWIYRRLQQP